MFDIGKELSLTSWFMVSQTLIAALTVFAYLLVHLTLLATKRSKGCLTQNGMLHMMFKLGLCAEKNWRRLRGFNYLAKVITGIKFKDGIEVTEVDQVAA